MKRRKKQHQCRWPLDNVKSNQAYDPELAAKIPIHFMEIDRKKNFKFFEWTPESGTPDSEDTESEGTETPIFRIRSSELHNEFFSPVMKTYSKQKWCGILLQLRQQKYRSPELESQLEDPWLSDYKETCVCFPYRWTNLSQREAHKCPHSGR
ncbi:hypothetical protein O181_049505 [Austropuccinia psidii MF-1]|uniref:Uncharacterized protein n=1 Tax=Austropuccinia psidii MF-1 TaxID=1389203 RepID=A0A9Q3DTQ0_9BASI|nr:hypothetical protein [Austropuccinia psidii MF-1]